MFVMKDVDPESSFQNAFVQEWLSAFFKFHEAVADDRDEAAFDRVIECIQETYSYIDHNDERDELIAGIPGTEPGIIRTKKEDGS